AEKLQQADRDAAQPGLSQPGAAARAQKRRPERGQGSHRGPARIFERSERDAGRRAHRRPEAVPALPPRDEPNSGPAQKLWRRVVPLYAG
nr:hypothetical protein [Tanacetum cinerariifolium]